MPPKFIYFDMGNVLLFFSHDRQAEQIGRLTGARPAAVKKLLYEDGLHWLAERGEVSGEQFLERVCEQTGSRPDAAALELASNDIFWLNAAIVPLVAQLRSAGLRLGVLSNTSAAHWQFCRARFRLLELFHLSALSFEIGAMKPAPQIYAAAAEMAGAAPAEIFFTDDRPENVAAARAAGWDAVVFESAAQFGDSLRERGVTINY